MFQRWMAVAVSAIGLVSSVACNAKIPNPSVAIPAPPRSDISGPTGLTPADADADGVDDSTDNCRGVANTDQSDADKDGRGDGCDNCPRTANWNQADADGDRIGDACESGIFSTGDEDGDGVANASDNCLHASNANQKDTDGDGLGDGCDNCPAWANRDQGDANADGIGDVCQGSGADSDGDGVADDVDNCDSLANVEQFDTDGDLVGDACDNCRFVANRDQLDANTNTVGDVCEGAGNPNVDGDADGVPDVVDNCASHSNANQFDLDGDGVGDACDNCREYYQPSNVCTGAGADADGDGLSNDADTCPNIAGSANDSNHVDADSDGLGAGCDNCPNHANPGQEDLNPSTPEGAACEPVLSIAPTEACETANSSTSVIRPNLVFVVDASGSMGGARETAWESALAPTSAPGGGGLSTQLASGNFNLALTKFTSSSSPDASACGALPSVSMSLSTPSSYTGLPGCGSGTFAQCFQTAGQIAPSGNTPTAAALNGVRTKSLYELNANAASDADSYRRSKAVLLVTDGEPNTCPSGGGARGASMRASIVAARSLAALDTNPAPSASNPVAVYVLGFTGVNPDMMQLLANAGDPAHPGPYQLCDTVAGHGAPCICNASGDSAAISEVVANGSQYRPAGCTSWSNVPKSTWYPINNVASIVNAVNAITARTATCSMVLTDNPALAGSANRSLLTVTLEGSSTTATAFAPSASNGYTLSGNTLTLNGSACSALQSAVQVDATATVNVRVACACSATTEVCDNTDNDCDGVTDEGCSTLSCDDVHGPYSPMCCLAGVEVCNGSDDDCDSQIDEGCPTNLCSTTPEVCDLADNNCNSQVDEGCGSACQPFVEVCDGVDNDCDGQADDQCLTCPNPSAEVCDDIDNDCDGSVDEGCDPGTVII